MKPEDVLATAKDSLTVRRVYLEPIERDGLTVIAAASIAGGAGGGTGHDKDGGDGTGGGFGVGAKPVGAFVIDHGNVRWRPAVDANRLITVAGAVAVAILLVVARIIHSQS
jgi:uncharacterized spore protein YtfJ